MSRPHVAFSLISTALVLAGCSMATRQASPDPAVTPVSAARHGARHADAHYALGRYYQGQIRYDQAIQSYQTVLDAQPDHVEARNALGVIYATQGRQALAEKELRAAVGQAPGAAHIHNNLGYALLLQGRVAEAISAFETALQRDPKHTRAGENLRAARARLGDGRDQAPTSPSPGQATDVMVLPVTAPTVEEVEPGMHLSAVAANVYELRLPMPIRPEASIPAAVPLAPQPVRVEVANGNGVEGLARRTSAHLKNMGYGPARLTNQKPFIQNHTEIQFRPGFELQAKGLQRALAGKGVMASSSQMRQDIQVRVVLGKDLRTTAQLAEIEAGVLRLAMNGE